MIPSLAIQYFKRMISILRDTKIVAMIFLDSKRNVESVFVCSSLKGDDRTEIVRYCLGYDSKQGIIESEYMSESLKGMKFIDLISELSTRFIHWHILPKNSVLSVIGSPLVAA